MKHVHLKLLGLSLLGIAGCVTTQVAKDPSHNVILQPDRIILPGTKVTADDQLAVAAVLKSFPKSIYKLHEYKDGNVTRTIGKMSDMAIGVEVVRNADANAKAAGLTSWGIACDSGSSAVHGSSTQSPEMMRRLTPILKKYSRGNP
ncbi:MAG: hypothetical protein ACJ8JD_03155 [Chthoniobacterales bacterium]